MIMTDVSTISILIDNSPAGGAIARQIVPFQVMRQGSSYRAIPLIEDGQRTVLKLPECLLFEFREHCIVPDRQRDPETIALIRNIIQECMLQDWIE